MAKMPRSSLDKPEFSLAKYVSLGFITYQPTAINTMASFSISGNAGAVLEVVRGFGDDGVALA